MALNGRSPSFRNNSKGAVAPSPYVCALNTLHPFITFFTIVRRCGKQYPLTVAMVFYVFVDVAYTCKLVGKLFPFTPSLIFTPVCAFLPLFLCHVSWRVSCEQITKSMQSRGMFSKAYFDLEVHPTDQVLFLRAQNLFFFQFVLFASTLHSFQLWLYGPFFFVYQPLWPFKPLSLLHLIDWCTVTS